MEAANRPRVKICCMAGVAEIEAAVRAGASAVGFVSAMPSGAGVVAEEQIAALAPRVPPGVASFLLTSLQDADALIAQARRLPTDALQLVDAVPPGTYARLRDALPGVRLVQAVHVVGEASLREAVRVAPFVDALLLDSGNPALAVKELGGTGRVHDWRVSRAIREAVAVPVWLAGGLTPDNAARAVAEVGPFGLDVCTGVRTDGALDAEKLSRFMDAVRGA